MPFAVNGVSFETAKKSIGLQPGKEGLEQILSAGVLYLDKNILNLLLSYTYIVCGRQHVTQCSWEGNQRTTLWSGLSPSHFDAISRNQT